jgi:hypothetical protein
MASRKVESSCVIQDTTGTGMGHVPACLAWGKGDWTY